MNCDGLTGDFSSNMDKRLKIAKIAGVFPVNAAEDSLFITIL
jgi:hypothetical protein